MHAIKHPFFTGAFSALALSALLILIIGQWTDIDLMIADYYFDPLTQTFPWRKTWFANELMHGYVKSAIINSGYLLILLAILDVLFRFKTISPYCRTRLRFVVVASLLVPTAIRWVKQYSVLHCPWKIDRYAGSAPFLRLLDHIPSGLQAGHCFPAGHATVGLWLAAFCVFWMPHRPKVAISVFFGGLSVGLILGWVQQMRGAHFLFHTLWSAWLASLVIVLMLLVANKIVKEGNKQS